MRVSAMRIHRQWQRNFPIHSYGRISPPLAMNPHGGKPAWQRTRLVVNHQSTYYSLYTHSLCLSKCLSIFQSMSLSVFFQCATSSGKQCFKCLHRRQEGHSASKTCSFLSGIFYVGNMAEAPEEDTCYTGYEDSVNRTPVIDVL